MENITNPNSVRFTDWWNKTLDESPGLIYLRKIFEEAWENAYNAGFDDADHSHNLKLYNGHGR